MLVSTRGFELHQAGKGSYSHDLEGAVGCVEVLELLDGTLGHRVEGGATPAPLHQADGLGCGTQSVEKVEVLDQRSLGVDARRLWAAGSQLGSFFLRTQAS